METNYPLSAERLYSLIGDKISEFPPHFIERLERKLEEFAQLRPRGDRVVQLQRYPVSAAMRPRAARTALPTGTSPYPSAPCWHWVPFLKYCTRCTWPGQKKPPKL